MGQRLVKNVMTGIAILSALGMTATPVLAAIPAGTVIFGDGKAFDLGYANTPANTAAIQAAMFDAASNGSVWVNGFSGNIVNNSTGTTVSTSAVPASMTYTNASGVQSIITSGTALSVASVSAINSTQVQVVFNNAVDTTSAQLGANYTIAGGTLLADPNGAVLQADGKTVILNTNAALTNFQQYTLSVANVKDTSGNKIATANYTFTVSDTAIPAVSSVTAKGNTTIVVAFSAPVKNAAYTAAGVYRNIIVDTVALTTSSAIATASADGTKLTIVYPAAITAGNHTVAIAQTGDSNDIVSYAGFKVPAVSNTVTIVASTTAPTVVSVTPTSQTSVTVVFSAPVNVSTSGDLAKFYWNLSNSVGDNANNADTITKVNDTTWTISFTGTGKPMPAGNVYFFVNGIVDYSSNAIAGNVATNTYGTTVAVTANALPSIASSSTKSNNTIYVNYATAMDPTTAQNAANYVVKDSTGALYAVSNAAWVSGTTDKKQIQLTVATMTSGAYTVTVSNVKDVVGNVMSSASTSATITDTSAPTLSTVSFEGQSIVANFSRAMAVSGTNSVLNTANYQYLPNAGSLGTLPAGTIITAFNSNKSVLITVPSTTTLNLADKLYIGQLSGSSLITVADASGNLYSPDAGTAIGAATSAVDISTATPVIKITDSATLKLVLASGVNNLSTVGASDFTVSIDGGNTTFVPANATLDATDKTSHTIIFTMPSGKTLSPTLAGVAGQIMINTVTTPSVTKDIFATKIAGSKSTGAGIIASNAIAPTLVSAAYVSPTQINATFSSNVSGALTALGNSIQIVQGTKVYTGYDAAPVEGKLLPAGLAGNVVSFTLNASDAIDPTQTITLRTVGADFMQATDASSNLLVANTTGVTVSSFAATSLAVSIANGAIASGDSYVATFNRNVDLTSIVPNWTNGLTGQNATMTFNADGTATIAGANVGSFSGFTVPKTGNAPVVLTSTGPTNLTITMGTVSGPVATANGVVKLTPSTAIKSASETAIGTFTVSTATAVSAKPFIISAKIVDAGTLGFGNDIGDKLVLTFSKPVKTVFGATGAPTTAELDTLFSGTPFAGTNTFTSTGATNAVAGNTLTISLATGTLTTDITTSSTLTTATSADITDGTNTLFTAPVTITPTN